MKCNMSEPTSLCFSNKSGVVMFVEQWWKFSLKISSISIWYKVHFHLYLVRRKLSRKCLLFKHPMQICIHQSVVDLIHPPLSLLSLHTDSHLSGRGRNWSAQICIGHLTWCCSRASALNVFFPPALIYLETKQTYYALDTISTSLLWIQWYSVC